MENIFELLTVSDKELVHSAMLKLMLENFPEFREMLLGEAKEYKYETEDGGKITDSTEGNSNKRIRFDIIGYPKDGSKIQEIVIENKFKSTPTVGQIELYNEFIAEKQKKNNNHQINKYLVVFCRKQIPADVLNYLKITNWEIRSYLSFGSKTPNEWKSILNILNEIGPIIESNIQPINQNINFLFKQYIAYLWSLQSNLDKYFNTSKYYRYLDIKDGNNQHNRFLGFQYLLYIQSLISERLPNLPSGNSLGQNHDPSVSFWFPLKADNLKIRAYYFGIDGDVIKLGFQFPRSTEDQIKEFRLYFDRVQPILVQFVDCGLKTLKIKTSKPPIRKTKIKDFSVAAVLTFKIKEGDHLKDDVVKDLVKIIARFREFVENEFQQTT